jgi:hypothetical protein
MTSRAGGRRPGRVRLTTRIVLLILGIHSTPAIAEDTPLSLADLEAYRLALKAGTDPTAPLVRFRDLWDRPEAYVGRPVRVEGQVARIFRQPRIGEFPPLTEAWITSKAGDPFCLVYPMTEGPPKPEVGASVRFGGTYLKRLRYQGGDVARVAPLIVGPEAPSVTVPPGTPFEGPSWSTADWVMGLCAASLVAMVLARRHLSRPPSMPTSLDPPPRFVDGETDLVEENREEAGEGAADEDPL